MGRKLPELPRASDDQVDKALKMFAEAAFYNHGKPRRSSDRIMRAARIAACAPCKSARRRRLGQRLIDRYRRKTGNYGAIHWDDFFWWLRDNWPTIVKALLSLLVLFL
jgi:hypothetical protein